MVLDGFRFAVVEDAILPIVENGPLHRVDGLPTVFFSGNFYEIVAAPTPLRSFVSSLDLNHEALRCANQLPLEQLAATHLLRSLGSRLKQNKNVLNAMKEQMADYKEDMDAISMGLTPGIPKPVAAVPSSSGASSSKSQAGVKVPGAWSEAQIKKWFKLLLPDAMMGILMPASMLVLSFDFQSLAASIQTDPIFLTILLDLALRDRQVGVLKYIAALKYPWSKLGFYTEKPNSVLPTHSSQDWEMHSNLPRFASMMRKLHSRGWLCAPFRSIYLRVLGGATEGFGAKSFDGATLSNRAAMDARTVETLHYLHEVVRIPFHVDESLRSQVDRAIMSLSLPIFKSFVNKLILADHYLNPTYEIYNWPFEGIENLAEKFAYLVNHTGLLLTAASVFEYILHCNTTITEEVIALVQYFVSLSRPGWNKTLAAQSASPHLVAMASSATLPMTYPEEIKCFEAPVTPLFAFFELGNGPEPLLSRLLKSGSVAPIPFAREKMGAMLHLAKSNVFRADGGLNLPNAENHAQKLLAIFKGDVSKLNAWIDDSTGSKKKPFAVLQQHDSPVWAGKKLQDMLRQGDVKSARKAFAQGETMQILRGGGLCDFEVWELITELIRTEQLESIKFLHEKGFPFRYLMVHTRLNRFTLEKSHHSTYVNPLLWPKPEVASFVDKDPSYPIIVEAVMTGNVPMVRFLRETAKCSFTYSTTQSHMHPLFWYAVNASMSPKVREKPNANPTAMMDYLHSQLVPFRILSAPTGANAGMPLACHAAAIGAVEALDWLYNHGLNILTPCQDAIEPNSYSIGLYRAFPMHFACGAAQLDVVRWFDEIFGSDVWTPTDARGLLPTEWARMGNCGPVLNWFRLYCPAALEFLKLIPPPAEYWEGGDPYLKFEQPTVGRQLGYTLSYIHIAKSNTWRSTWMDIVGFNHDLLESALQRLSQASEVDSHFDYLRQGAGIVAHDLKTWWKWPSDQKNGTTSASAVVSKFPTPPGGPLTIQKMVFSRPFINFVFGLTFFPAKISGVYTAFFDFLSLLALSGLDFIEPMIAVYPIHPEDPNRIELVSPARLFFDTRVSFKPNLKSLPSEMLHKIPKEEPVYVSIVVAAIIGDHSFFVEGAPGVDAGPHDATVGPANSMLIWIFTMFPELRQQQALVTVTFAEVCCRGQLAIAKWMLEHCKIGKRTWDLYGMMMHTLLLKEDLTMLIFLHNHGFAFEFTEMVPIHPSIPVFPRSVMLNLGPHRNQIYFPGTTESKHLFLERPTLVNSLLMFVPQLTMTNNPYTEVTLEVRHAQIAMILDTILNHWSPLCGPYPHVNTPAEGHPQKPRPIHIAALSGNIAALELLMGAGANFTLLDGEKRSIDYYAQKQPHVKRWLANNVKK